MEVEQHPQGLVRLISVHLTWGGGMEGGDVSWQQQEQEWLITSDGWISVWLLTQW